MLIISSGAESCVEEYFCKSARQTFVESVLSRGVLELRRDAYKPLTYTSQNSTQRRANALSD